MISLVAGIFLSLLSTSSAYAGKNVRSRPIEIETGDLKRVPSIRPTTYYITNEKNTSCKGRYRGVSHTGKETRDLYTPEGKFIATVCKRFASVLLMEGSGILKDRGAGELVVNYARKIKGQARYNIENHCKFGHGVRQDLCLLPYQTIAANNKVNRIGEIFFVPAAVGLRLPDGTLHDGTFIVRDTGGAFNNAGANRVDLFVGTELDTNNVFQRAGFDKTRTFEAYKVKGRSADRIKEKLRLKFGELY